MRLINYRRFALVLLFSSLINCLGFSVCSAKEPVTSIHQLNSPEYTVAVSESGAAFIAVKRDLPGAKLIYSSGQQGYDAVRMGKADAYAFDRRQMEIAIANGLTGVKILPGSIGEKVEIAIGISRASKIPNLKQKVNQFISELKSSGTFQDMYQRWVIDARYTMPDIDVNSSSESKIVIGTIGLVMPFSFYEGNNLTGFDIELGRRLASWLGRKIEFRVYDYGGMIAAAATGEIDCIMADLNFTPERAEKIDFSDTLFTEETALMIKDDGTNSEHVIPQAIRAFDGKRIAVFTGSVHAEIVKEVLPSAKLFYFEGSANALAALTSGKVDAIVNDDSILREMKRENPSLTVIDEYLKTFDNAFIFTKTPESDKLRNEINEFIRTLKSDGTLKNMLDIWTGNDDSMKTLPDYEHYPNTNGTLRIAVDVDNPPFNYIKDGKMAGYDVDIIVRFCKLKGYRPKFSGMNFSSVIPSVFSGKCDIGIGAITITPERSESVNFSEPVYTGGAMIFTMKHDASASPGMYAPLAGKRIAVVTGTTHPDIALKYVPDAKLVYFNSIPDTFTALKTEKVDAVCTAIPMARLAMIEDDSLEFFGEQLTYIECAPIFAKTEHGRKLCEQFSEFLKTLWNNRTINEIDSIWFGKDERRKVIMDYSNLPAPNGILRMAADVSLPPCTYIKDNVIVGYDVDCAVRFCEAYGYGLEIVPMNFNGVIPAVQSGKCDFGMCAITRTDEREESVLFSYPNVRTGNAFVVRKSNIESASSKNSGRYTSLQELDGKKIGVQTGVDVWAEMAKSILPHAEIVYFNTFADIVAALEAHKIEAFMISDNAFNLLAAANSRLARFDENVDAGFNVSFGFAKTEAGKKLSDEVSEFLRSLKASGELQRIVRKWEGADESAKTLPDYKNFPAPKGILSFATEGEYPPYNYYRGTEIAGLDIDLAARFCEAYGYGLKITSMSYDSIIPALISGKYDFAGDLSPNDEHGEVLYFSEPYYYSYTVLACLKSALAVNVKGKYTAMNDLASKKIAVQTGTLSATLVAEKLPNSQIEYFDALSDMLIALKTGKVDALGCTIFAAMDMMHHNDDVIYLDEWLRSSDLSPIFTKSERGKKLCEEYGEFVKTLWEDGTIKALESKWLGKDDSIKTVKDYSNLPAPNGILRIGVDTSWPPLAYVKDNRVVGYDIDIAVRFCEAKGYGLEVVQTSVSGIIAAVQSGKCDFSQSMNFTEERAQVALFSPTPTAHAGNVIVVRKYDTVQKSSGGYESINDLAGKRIGVQTGTRSPEIVRQFIPTAKLVYHDSPVDNLIALRIGKIDAACMPDTTASLMISDNDDVAALGGRFTNTKLASIFPKTERGRKLCKEYSEFVKSLWEDGTINKINSVWLGRDEDKRILKDYTKLPAINGTLEMAVDTAIPPMIYVKDNRIVGYDIDIAVRFCEAKGYALEVVPMSFPAIIPAVNSGKCDFSCGMTYTPERAESVLFASTPNVEVGSIIIVRKSDMQDSKSGQYMKIKDLAGKKIGIILGANHDEFVAEKIPDAKIEYFNDIGAVTLALQTGKIDAFTNTLPTAIYMTHEHKDMSYISEPVENTYTYSAFTSSDKGHKICNEYAEFTQSLWDNGTIKRLQDKWIFSENEMLRTLEDYSKLSADNGVLRMAIDTGRMPFAYVKDNRIIGYDIEIASMFCKSKGYGLEVYAMDFAGILGSIKTGKCDLTGSITRTEERAETMLFSPVPNAETPIVLIVMKSPETMKPAENVKISETEITLFIEELNASFERTFIREARWKLFTDGIISTMIITVLSIIFGTILGFIVYLSCRNGNLIANLITRFFVWLIQGMPMVVLLMILYYIIFGKVDIAGIWVAVIAFTLTFGSGVYGMLVSGVKALDRGQLEAAYALGFTDRRAFFTIILPQAALHFMPAYKAEVVALIKATAIVGYIAVQDLTKMGDIVRSRTYEAFFPLIAVAVIYFILAGLLNVIVSVIHNRIRPEKRTKNDILRGIEIHD